MKTPAHCVPAMCDHSNNVTHFTGAHKCVSNLDVGVPTMSLEGTTVQLPLLLQWAVKHSTGWENFEKLAEARHGGDLIAVTDGSHKDERGAAAWIICDIQDTKIRITGNIPSPGEPECQTSTRAELSGTHGIAAIAKNVSTRCQSGTFTVGCDSTEAIRKVSTHKKLTVKTKDYDLANGVRRLMGETNWKWKCKHICGHQDKKTPHLGKIKR